MHRVKRSIVPILVIVAAIIGSWAVAAKAAEAAYVHVANAQVYARQHAWKTFCSSSSYYCPTYPWATGWYSRVSNTEVRVEVATDRRGSGRCYRIFDVRGDDSNLYISTSGSSAYWACQ